MTEAEWLSGTDWHRMLLFLRRRKGIASRPAGRRKLRLLACACCRREWGLLVHSDSRQALETAELSADGRVDEETRAEAERQARAAVAEISRLDAGHPREAHEASRQYSAASAVLCLLAEGPLFELMEESIGRIGRLTGLYGTAAQQEAWQRAMGDLVRDMFGNPFRATPVKRAWRTATVVQLARGIYLEHAFDRLPILGDALQEAGCDNETVLAHCRDPKPVHARGCWVVDQVLGKK
jgi:hypothetical protein